MIWKIIGDGTRTAHHDRHAFKITVDHVGLNLSAAPILGWDEWTNTPEVGKFEIIQFGFNYDHLKDVADKYGL